MWEIVRFPGLLVLAALLGWGCAAGGSVARPAGAGSAPTAPPGASASASSAAPAARAAAPDAIPLGQPLRPPVVVRAATTPSLSNGGRYVAMERGYFEEEGIQIEDVPSDTSAQLFPALAAGQIDLLAGGPTAGLFNAIAQGIPVRIVLDQWTAYPGNEAGGLLIRKDLIDSGRVREVADLRGLRISYTAKGHTTQKLVADLLATANLRLSDIQEVELNYGDLNVALGTGNVDGGVTIEPFGGRAVADGYAVRWRAWPEVEPYDNPALIMYSETFADQKNEVAKRYARAYIRGLREYTDARLKGINREFVIAAFQKHTALKDRALYDIVPWPSSNPDGRVNAEAIAAVQDWLHERGYVPTKVDLAKVIDNQFADFAVAQLGPYQP
ncbi:MAG TPA: ABC transporter substrate-binding protein [Chloroflexota bacterium]|nr:ABC transporter substrate-binding protein [Chloroflexota bacterium]